MSHKRTSLTLKQLRIGRSALKSNIKPCTDELNAYLRSLKSVGEDGNVPYEIAQSLTNCAENIKSLPAASIQFHMQKFIVRKKY